MRFPSIAFGANAVVASHILCRIRTAILAQLTIGTNGDTVFTFAAFLTEVGAVRAVFTAVCAKVIRTVAAVIAFAAHSVGTVDAYAAVGAEFVDASRTLAAVLTYGLRAIGADDTAFLTDFHAVAALPAILAEQILCAFPADIAGSTEFVRTV